MSLPPDVDNGPALQAATWTLTAVSCLFIVLRFWARIYKRAVGVDDGLMLASWVSSRSTSALEKELQIGDFN